MVPIVVWLPKYTLQKGINDFIAGMAVGLTVIPQGIAYASIARLPAAFGLYSSFMAPFIYCIMGTSKVSKVKGVVEANLAFSNNF